MRWFRIWFSNLLSGLLLEISNRSRRHPDDIIIQFSVIIFSLHFTLYTHTIHRRIDYSQMGLNGPRSLMPQQQHHQSGLCTACSSSYLYLSYCVTYGLWFVPWDKPNAHKHEFICGKWPLIFTHTHSPLSSRAIRPTSAKQCDSLHLPHII